MELANIYDEYFSTEVDEDQEPPLTYSSPSKQELNDCGGDFGMELEQEMTPASLALALGFKTGRPTSFNALRHRSLTPWDSPTPFPHKDVDPLPPLFSKSALHWHQLAGVHSIVRSVFSEAPNPSHTAGVLIGDEVGLGKTAQAIAFIAFLQQTIVAQKSNRSLPRILSKNLFSNS